MKNISLEVKLRLCVESFPQVYHQMEWEVHIAIVFPTSGLSPVRHPMPGT